MNPRIVSLFDRIEIRLIESPAVVSYRIISREISPDAGKLRFRADLISGGLLECFVYYRQRGDLLPVEKHSFHWQDEQGNLVCRLDNAPHHVDLPHAPHHLHTGADRVEGFGGKPDLFDFICEVECHYGFRETAPR